MSSLYVHSAKAPFPTLIEEFTGKKFNIDFVVKDFEQSVKPLIILEGSINLGVCIDLLAE